MLNWLRAMTLAQAWDWCKTGMVLITPAAIVWATIWPVVWSYYVQPAIAQVAEETLADNLATIQEQIDKIIASQANVGEASRDAQASDKDLAAMIEQQAVLIQQLYCVQTGQPVDCEP